MGIASGNPTWQGKPSTATPITAGRLNAIEDALDLAASRAPIDPRDYGAVGDGVTDDTAAMQDAFAAALALRQLSIGTNVYRPGATVYLPPGLRFHLATLAAPIEVSCNVEGTGATISVPASYAASVLRVGHATSGHVLHSAKLNLPNITGDTTGPTHTAGSVGITIQNLYHSVMRFGRVSFMETGHHYTGVGIGTGYNTFFPGWVDQCKVAWRIAPGIDGWVNQNQWIGGGVSQSPVWSTPPRAVGWRHLTISKGTSVWPVHANTFTGCSFEGSLSEYQFDIADAYDNVWHGLTRFEGDLVATPVVFTAGTPWIGANVNVDTTQVVDRAVYFDADVAPGGLSLHTLYYITFEDASSFQVSLTKGGSPITFTTDGTNVRMYMPPSLRFDNTGGITQGNVIRDYYVDFGLVELIRVGAAANPARAPITG